MARQTRQQRRDRRRQQAETAVDDGATSSRTPARSAGRPLPAAEPHAHEVGPRRGRFVVETWGELKKVDWPNQRQVMTGTVVVIIACVIVGAYLYGTDLVLRPFVERILLGR